MRNKIPSGLLYSNFKSRQANAYRTCFTLPVSTACTQPLVVMESGIALLALRYTTSSFTAFARSGKGCKSSRESSCYAACPKFFPTTAWASSSLKVSTLQPAWLTSRISSVPTSYSKMTREFRASRALPPINTNHMGVTKA